MKAVIHYSGVCEDCIIVKADSIEELRELAFAEVNRRGWEFERCWSEVIEWERRNDEPDTERD